MKSFYVCRFLCCNVFKCLSKVGCWQKAVGNEKFRVSGSLFLVPCLFGPEASGWDFVNC